ncbi:MAG: response regulator transcription factor [Acidimicrobiia bacterium]
MRIVIAEDTAIMRNGLVALLEERGHEVPAAVEDAPGLLEAVAAHRPDVAIVDIRMGPTFTDDGLRAALTLRRTHPDTAVLLFSQYIETTHARELLADTPAGVGYLLKDRVADVGEFMEALTRVAAGGTALDPEVVAQLLGASSRTANIATTLTARENDVLELIAEGRSNAAIAAQLDIGEGTIEKHIASIFMKLDLPVSESDNRRVLAVLRYLGA